MYQGRSSAPEKGQGEQAHQVLPKKERLGGSTLTNITTKSAPYQQKKVVVFKDHV